VPNYAANVHNIVHKHGGKYLARSGNVTTVEGEGLDTTLIALIQFPSMDAVQAFAGDPDYAPYAEERQRQQAPCHRQYRPGRNDRYLPKG
jgi:uncharacterized protein (DUF1330 family)